VDADAGEGAEHDERPSDPQEAPAPSRRREEPAHHRLRIGQRRARR
jgi:hypothetical protein